MSIATVTQAGCLDWLAPEYAPGRDPVEYVHAVQRVVAAGHWLAEQGASGVGVTAHGTLDMPPFQVLTERTPGGGLHVRVENMAMMRLLVGDYFYGSAMLPRASFAAAAAMAPGSAQLVHRTLSGGATFTMARREPGRLRIELDLAVPRARGITRDIVASARGRLGAKIPDKERQAAFWWLESLQHVTCVRIAFDVDDGGCRMA